LLNYLDGRSQTIVSTSKRTIADRYRRRARTLLIESGRAIDEEIADNSSSKGEIKQEFEPVETAQASDEEKHRAPF
jgi:hypothetical protein